MATGTMLSVLVSNLRTVLGNSTNVAIGTEEVPALKYLLKSTQNILWAQHTWPHLRLFANLTLSAGQRYYDCPAGITYDRIIEANVYVGNRPMPIRRGIDFYEYAQFNSDLDLRADPVRAWDLVRVDPTKTQIEIWPIPATDGGTVGFHSLANLRALSADADVCDLDDDLLVFEAAVDALLGDESPKAARVAKKAAALRGFLLANGQSTKNVGPNSNQGRRMAGATVVVSG